MKPLEYKTFMQNYYYVEVQQNVEDDSVSDLEEKAISHYKCTGIEEFSISEERVDEILGERSYSGADIPTSVIDYSSCR